MQHPDPSRLAANLQRLLRPKSIAVFGGGWAEEVVRQTRKIGFAGAVWPVHPKKDEVAGYKAYRSVAELPGAPDASFVGVNRELTVEVMRELSSKGAGGAVCFAAGFKEAGTKGLELHHALLEAAGDMAFMGPNCYGTLNYLDGAVLWPDQHGGERVERGVALIAQSGNIAVNVTMQQRGLPLAYVLTLGNQARIGFSRLIEALLEDSRVTAIGLIMEAIDDLPAFDAAVAKAAERKIPIAAMKLGASARGAEAALSHTASLAGADAIVDAYFRRAGIARLKTLPELLETLKLLHFVGPLAGRDIVSLSCSGGEAALMSDLIEESGLNARPFGPEQKAKVEGTLSELVTVANPLDYHTFIWGNEERLAATFTSVLEAGFDLSYLVLDFPRGDRCSDASWQPTLRGFAAAAKATGAKAALLASLGECLPERIVRQSAELGIGAIAGLQEGLAAAEAAARIGEALRREPAKPLLIVEGAPRDAAALDEWEAKAALEAHGLVRPPGRLVTNEAEASAAFRALRAPVVVKACSRDILHKTEAGAVRLGVRTEAELRDAVRHMLSLAKHAIVEEMVTDAVAELIVGVTRDPQFGPTLVVGSGGILVELVGDSRTLTLPTTFEEVHDAILSLKAAKLMLGFRGRPVGDIEAAAAAVMAVARFTEANAARLAELDVNPLLVRPRGKGVLAADALIRIGRE